MVETTKVRCPDLDQATRLEARRKVSRPAHWGKPGPDGKRVGATSGDLMDLADAYEIGEARKNGTLARVIGEYDRCRNANEPSS